MPKRFNIPGNRTPLTIDKQGKTPEETARFQKKYFKQLQDGGIVPSRFNSLEELQDEFLGLLSEGMSDRDAAKQMGVDYRNVVGNGILGLNISSKGQIRGINMRTLREDIKPDEAAWFKRTFGEAWFEDYKRYRALEWGDVKPKKGDEAIIEKFSPVPRAEFESAKEEADFLRDRLASVFGKNGPASQVHRGHGNSALEGASVGKANLVPEWGPGNVSHGSAPRYDKRIMADLNMSANDLQNYFDDLLQREGLTLTPTRIVGNYVSADEYLRELQQGTSLGNPQSTVPSEIGRVDPQTLEMREIKANDAIRQITEENIRMGVDPIEARVQAKRRVSDYALSNSVLFDTTYTVGGEVTQVQPPKPKGRQVTVVTPNQVDAVGRPKRDAVRKQTAWETGTGKRNIGGKIGRALIIPAVVGIANEAMAGNLGEAGMQAVESFTPLGDIMSDNTAPGTIEAEQQRIKQMEQDRIRREQERAAQRQRASQGIGNRMNARKPTTPGSVKAPTQTTSKEAIDWFNNLPSTRNFGL